MPKRRGEAAIVKADAIEEKLLSARISTSGGLLSDGAGQQFAKEFLGTTTSALGSIWNGQKRSNAMSIRCREYQLAGNFEEAFKLAKIKIDDAVVGVLQGKAEAQMCSCCRPIDEQLETWSEFLCETLIQLNLPVLAKLAIQDDATNGRLTDCTIPIVQFPFQKHTDKAMLSIDLRNANEPQLIIETTCVGYRMPLSLWQRPVDIDLLGLEMLSANDLPTIVRQQLGL